MKLLSLNMAVLIASLIALDQTIKFSVETYLPFQTLVDVLPFLGLYRTWNEGVAFSMLWGVNDKILLIITGFITLFVVWMARQTKAEDWLARTGFAMIISGALGNLIDRFIYGHVVDYVLFHLPTWSFAVFNLADALISVGTILIIWVELTKRHKTDAQ
jgi:signal peptidase II